MPELLALALLCIGWLLFYIHCLWEGDGRESFGDKREWGMLQVLESENRTNSISKMEFVEKSEYRIVCCPGSGGQRTWIMLNPKNPPYYKQIPSSDYSLTVDNYKEICAHRTTSTVEECLRSHVRDR